MIDLADAYAIICTITVLFLRPRFFNVMKDYYEVRSFRGFS